MVLLCTWYVSSHYRIINKPFDDLGLKATAFSGPIATNKLREHDYPSKTVISRHIEQFQPY
jgi:hypothetical protein